MQLNENKVRLSGTANLSKELELCKSYDLHITEAEVRKSLDVPNDNGTFDRVYTLLISELSSIQIISERETIKARKKGSQAQMFRAILNHEADELGQDREEYYKKEMTILIKNRLNK